MRMNHHTMMETSTCQVIQKMQTNMKNKAVLTCIHQLMTLLLTNLKNNMTKKSTMMEISCTILKIVNSMIMTDDMVMTMKYLNIQKRDVTENAIEHLHQPLKIPLKMNLHQNLHIILIVMLPLHKHLVVKNTFQYPIQTPSIDRFIKQILILNVWFGLKNDWTNKKMIPLNCLLMICQIHHFQRDVLLVDERYVLLHIGVMKN
mmetsp:Transcript_9243/g.13704  ORF Transcript_9243/g.13704 Transcript_9243/m.13704 type:complete len:203 (-) Transcript_9243:573-1181(-)